MPANFDPEENFKELEEDSVCPKCGHKGIYYLGSDALHGNPFSPASDCEVVHNYCCYACNRAWSE